jgi:acyl-CoA hydrolase
MTTTVMHSLIPEVHIGCLRKELCMEAFCFVRPEHLSHQGFLFGGNLLKWVDEYAWLAAARDFPGYTLVTRAMDDIQFTKRVRIGAILRFSTECVKQGSSSVTYSVNVFASNPESRDEELVFSTNVVFVAVDNNSNKITLPRLENNPAPAAQSPINPI